MVNDVSASLASVRLSRLNDLLDKDSSSSIGDGSYWARRAVARPLFFALFLHLWAARVSGPPTFGHLMRAENTQFVFWMSVEQSLYTSVALFLVNGYRKSVSVKSCINLK